MKQAIGIRLPKEILEKIEELSEREMEDRSSVIRKLVILGFAEFIRKKAAEDYIKIKDLEYELKVLEES